MDRRIPYHLKGKGISADFAPPPQRRIRAPELDTSDLIQENSLTLMGRLTNPKVQRLWSLIPFLSNRWNLRGKAVGSDLGKGCFQFCFDFEEDLQKVLSNRPYHFDGWMVILQRWEPVIDASFPSQIPFWIELQGLPLHYWKPEMVINIGEELGAFQEHDLSSSSAKIRVLIDGHQPLTKETIVEFRDGSEVTVTLEYKNLKGHCQHCHRLSHDKKDCPGLVGITSNHSKPASPSRETPSSRYDNNQRQKDSQGPIRSHTPRNQSSHSHPYSRSTHIGKANSRTRREEAPVNSGYVSCSEARDFHSPNRSRSYLSKDQSRDFRHHQSSRDNRYRGDESNNWQWREKSKSLPAASQDVSESSRTRRPPIERNLDKNGYSPRISSPIRNTEGSRAPRLPVSPISTHLPTTEEVMGELREVTVQYMACADPTESAARRSRMMQGEARGLMAETAAKIIASSVAAQANNFSQATTLEQLTECLPATSVNHNSGVLPQESVVKKRRGRPPLNKQSVKSPLRLTGAKSQKRNLVLSQGSPKRKSGQDQTAQALEDVPSSSARSGGSRPQAAQPDSSSRKSKQSNPKISLIPAIKKGGVDFQNPPKPLP
ncbi:Zinc knuckle CX2CX4HX4C [Arabidopsis thaliana x Arabidopsis arenosa]|uniref:Zinc knuckle CX2CX4HX4C n=1 Tax=Arabidopsis thaliana x Arabidopsis arenosa TaxID=1240361 RepID=A0A8T2C4E3_9BRAS|nr:Zinc knuckle CX2CX4HX4C [Arabidopsis thaliana x Arabidopsis arenosa]